MKTYQHFIDGQYVDSSSGEWIESIDPFSGESWARVPNGNEEDVNRAVMAAKTAFENPEWADLAPAPAAN